jgi:hypothetical protein
MVLVSRGSGQSKFSRGGLRMQALKNRKFRHGSLQHACEFNRA